MSISNKYGLLHPKFPSSSILEIGIDEAGRGPLLGRVYAAGVILPKDKESFNFDLLKDSKKFTSSKKLEEVANYIKQNSLYYSIHFRENDSIDKSNIRKSVHECMQDCIKEIYNKNKNIYALIDGNDFTPVQIFENNQLTIIPHQCIVQGDNSLASIAAASILAKFSRDEWIREICKIYPKLNEYYGIEKNKGYPTKQHVEGIRINGISPYHRKSFGICKDSLDWNENKIN
tara:strand:- start:682 stop:1374 length:693 start_codon:yes stop_codon:yes gene_type:complete